MIGYQVRSRHLFLEMLTGALHEEKQSFENINICILVSTSLMVFTSIMEALAFYLYNNKVRSISNITELTIFKVILKYFLQFHPRNEIVRM